MASSTSHHHDGSSASSTPRAAAGVGNGGSYQHPPPLFPAPPLAQAQGGTSVRLMCSFGGRIMPRPGDHQLRYVGGETRIVSVPRAASYAALVAALAKVAPALFAPGRTDPALRYQLPQDDLDALISITSDDDVDNLMDELDRLQGLATAAIKPPRLRLFLFAASPDHAAAGAFGSVLSGAGDASSDQWFLDALNAPAPAPAPIERGRSEASSIVSEVPDYLFGLDTTSDEPSPGTGSRPKSDTEMVHGEDDAPAPALGAPPSPYVAESAAPWPAPPPPYMSQPVYYVPVHPLHYLDPAAQGGYMPGPVYHIVGGGGSEAPGDLYAAGGVGGVYGVPHPVQPFPPMMYAHPPPGAVVYTSEGKPPEGGAHSS